MKKCLLYITLLLINCTIYAQDKSNRGTEFWLGYGYCVSFDVGDYSGPNNQDQILYISTEEAADVTVSVNGTSWSRTVSIPANSVNVSIILPKSGADDCRIRSEGIFDRAVHIVSTTPVVVYAHMFNTQLSAATMLLPVNTYGYTYYSVNYKQPPVNNWGKNWLYVIASEDNTRIEITVTDTTESGVLPGETITADLNKGQLYCVFGKVDSYNESDLTGSKIVSVPGSDGNCHPIAMFSGCGRLITCVTDGGEAAQQQIFPASAWGTRYLTFHSIIATSNPLTTPFLNYFRVIVADPATVVKKNGVVLTGLQKNTWYEFQSTSGDYIEADKPILVCQYTPNSNQCTGTNASPQGDPEMLFLPPIEQGIKKARVYNTKNANITVNYLTIIIPNNGVSSLKINGTAVPASQRRLHPNNSNYTVVARRLLGPASQIDIESDSAFGAMIYGSGVFESYGYIAGTLINNLNSIGSIYNVYNSTATSNTFTCPQSPFTMNIQTAYRATSLQWLCSTVPGMLPAKDTTIADPVPIDSQIINGRKYFTYELNSSFTLADTGIFNIPVIYTSPEIDHCSHTEKSFVTVVVKKGPVADYNYTYRGCPGDTAFFNGLADVNNYTISKYIWNFDDNTADTSETTFKKFAGGNHPVSLKTIADIGCVDDTTQTITTFPKPVPGFNYNRNICVEDSILITDNSSISIGSISAWIFNFDDGSSRIKNDATAFHHTYINAGTYDVSLYVISDKGCNSDTASVPVQVNNKPLVSFSVTGTPCEDSIFLFTPTVTTNGNTILNAAWHFGDGQTQTISTTNAITHSYTSAQSNIAVKLAVSGEPGCESDTALQIIPVINAAPDANFNFSSSSFCPEKDIAFEYTGTSNIQSWLWNLGDGSSANTSQTNNSYAIGGTYSIKLFVKSVDGCGANETKQLTIYNNPDIDAGPTVLKLGEQPVLINATMSDTTGYTFQWSPSLFLNNDVLLKPLTNAIEDIVYSIKVSGGPGNCEATDSVLVKVLKDVFIPSAFSPNNDGLNDTWKIPALAGNNNANVIIYNRWGQIVFESAGQAWDGTYKGKPQPAGAYYYLVKPDVKKIAVYKGSVMIVR